MGLGQRYRAKTVGSTGPADAPETSCSCTNLKMTRKNVGMNMNERRKSDYRPLKLIRFPKKSENEQQSHLHQLRRLPINRGNGMCNLGSASSCSTFWVYLHLREPDEPTYSIYRRLV
ncbi:hypothetical protein SDJN02_10662, partial [Cucurbita argyrosperma subsp. argyrosperma]